MADTQGEVVVGGGEWRWRVVGVNGGSTVGGGGGSVSKWCCRMVR